VPFVQEAFAEVAAEEASASGYKNSFHRNWPSPRTISVGEEGAPQAFSRHSYSEKVVNRPTGQSCS
jgi:hypothetical protein